MKSQSDFVPLKDWALKTFGFTPAAATLSAYAKTKQISPAPVKFARRWMCQRNAKFVGRCHQHEPTGDPLIDRILNDGSST
ncbi:excisionase [Ferrimonas aestuarii]|uniref:Excisionase-like domain-containing protein n=1 Tax=Ferrimonas aestuarii TaxID=2569539 RepID=A0A4U1BQ82_9GAMM|nr:excisionase [Ferrimonas aestuarii]TKB53273.1 hypothetical protein FCL42_14470 [Ferrimonas aestuarii]